jgi:argininosuccinate lyase
MTEKRAWGGRFSLPPDKVAEEFTASIMFDNRLAREDVRGSIAHVRMLGTQGIIPEPEAARIEEGLWQIWDEVEGSRFDYSIADEDVHTAVERRLRELIGPLQGKLHTARSRNDQVVTDVRLWTRDALLTVMRATIELVDALLDVAAGHVTTVMPGYTHTQRAQPVVLAHHLLAYVEMLKRDLQRIQQTYERANVSALGSGALAGVTYPVDRMAVAEDLGFAGITANSMDAIADRDFALDAMYALAMIQLHMSRMSEELVYWSSGEFRFVEISDAFATGSSIMPQKKNPDVAELSRGKSGRVFGRFAGTLSMLKGLPLTYNSDMQEDKEALFDVFDTVNRVLTVFPGMIRSLTFDTERMAGAAVADFSLATDAADLLARHGVPFREAHEVVGALVGRCAASGRTFNDLSDAEWTGIHPVFAKTKPPLTAEESVAARDIPGGTAPNRVSQALVEARDSIETFREWTAVQTKSLEYVMSRPNVGADEELMS